MTEAHQHALSGRQGDRPFDMGARCMTKPMPKSSCKMSIIAKAAGIRNFAERLTCTEKRPAFQKLRGLIQTNGIYQFAAGTAARR